MRKVRQIGLVLILFVSLALCQTEDRIDVDPCVDVEYLPKNCKKCSPGFIRMFTVTGIFCAIWNEEEKTCTPSNYDTATNRITQTVIPDKYTKQIYQNTTDVNAQDEEICWGVLDFIAPYAGSCVYKTTETFAKDPYAESLEEEDNKDMKSLYKASVGCLKCSENYSYARLVLDTTINVWVRICEYRKVNQQSKDWLAIRENDPGDKFGYIYSALNWMESAEFIHSPTKDTSGPLQLKMGNKKGSEVATIVAENDGFRLFRCSQLIPHALDCRSTTEAKICEKGYRLAEMVPTPGFPTSGQVLRQCLYNSCGYQDKTTNDEHCSQNCIIWNCRVCESKTVSNQGILLNEPVPSCSMCNANLYRKQQIKQIGTQQVTFYTCEKQLDAVKFDFIVKSTYDLMIIPPEDLEIQNGEPSDPLLGRSFSKPYLFVTQVLHDLFSERRDMQKYSEVRAHIWLTKGTHPFFWCLPGFNKPNQVLSYMGVIKNQVSLDSSDAQVDLTHVPGQVILLHFWSTLCPPCQVSMHTNQEMLSRKGAEWLSKVRIIGISIDEGKDKIKSFLQEKQWDQMEHYWSPNGVFVANKLYGERDLPRALLVDTNGKIVFEGDPATRNLEQDINDLLQNKQITGKGTGTGAFYEQFDEKILPQEEYTKFCEEFPNLAFVQPLYDNVRLDVRPMECKERSGRMAHLMGGITTEDVAFFDDNCIENIDDEKPIISVQSSYAHFNISREANFTSIEFQASDALAIFEDGEEEDSKHKARLEVLLSSFPVMKCRFKDQISTRATVNPLIALYSHGTMWNSFQSYKCALLFDGTLGSGEQAMPTAENYKNCTKEATDNKGRQNKCHGLPWQKSFWWREGSRNDVFAYRHRTLFNLYSFDSMRSTLSHTPTLRLENCLFRQFLKNYESLINIETTNYAPMGKFDNFAGEDSYAKEAYFFQFGDDRAAHINITSSRFEHSSFCKGLIVYRKAEQFDSMRVLNFTHQNALVQDSIQYQNRMIQLRHSEFHNLQFGQVLTHITSLDKTEMAEELTDRKILFRNFFHLGVVINIDGFMGPIQVESNKFTNNMINVPDLHMGVYNVTDRYSQYTAKGKLYNVFYKEAQNHLAFRTCDPHKNTSMYFFDEGLDPNEQLDELEELYEKYERASLMYIAHSSNQMVFIDNDFQDNIGLYGGALNIDSPDYGDKQLAYNASKPYIIIDSNKFKRNMAYIAGNAIYVRLTQRIGNEEEAGHVCGGGVLIRNNGFFKNIGLKKTNGGAVSILCSLLNETLTSDRDKYDLEATSGIQPYDLTPPWDRRHNYVGPNNLFLQTVGLTDMNSERNRRTYTLFPFTLLMEKNDFSKNSAGQRGSAAFIKHINHLRIIDNEFSYNGPVFAFNERINSPYYLHLAGSSRTISYYRKDDEIECWDEFQWFDKCARKGQSIDMPQHQGALYIEQTILDSLLLQENFSQNTYIVNNIFYGNQVNQILSDNQVLTQASALFLVGGKNNILRSNKFRKHQNEFFTQLRASARHLFKYMPTQYFQGQQGSMIFIKYPVERETSDNQYPSAYNFKTEFTRNHLLDNMHYQVLTFSQLQYGGSLLQFESIPPKVTLDFNYNVVQNNAFIGNSGSLIQVSGGILTAKKNQFTYNGRAESDYVSGDAIITMRNLEDKYLDFPYDSYRLKPGQGSGIFSFEMKWPMAVGKAQRITDNVFSHNFCQRGCAASASGSQKMQIFFGRNRYDNMVAGDGGSIFDASTLDYTLGPYRSGQLVATFVNETIFNSFGGAIHVVSGSQKPLIFIKNTKFTNCFGTHGGAIYMKEGGGVFCKDCVFTMQKDIRLKMQVQKEWLSSIISQNFRYQTPLWKFASNSFLKKNIDEISNQYGQVYIENSQPIKTLDGSVDVYLEDGMEVTQGEDWAKEDLVIENMATIEPIVRYLSLLNLLDEMFDARYLSGTSMLINPHFQYLVGGKAAAIAVVNAPLLIKITQGHRMLNIAENHAGNGGIIFGDEKARMHIKDLNMTDNTGSCFKLQEKSHILIEDSIFRKNEGEVFFATKDVILDVLRSTFELNVAKNGAILKAIDNNKAEIQFRDSFFRNIYSEISGFYLYRAQVKIENCHFLNLFSRNQNPGFTLIFSTLTANNFTVDYQDDEAEYQELESMKKKHWPGHGGDPPISNKNAKFGFFYMNFQSKIVMNGISHIHNTYGKAAGLMEVLGNSNLTINPGLTVRNSTCALQSGSIFTIKNSRHIEIDGAHMHNNKKTVFYVVAAFFKLSNSIFHDNKENIIWADQSPLLWVQGVTMSNQTDMNSLYNEGLGIYCRTCHSIVVDRCRFQNITGSSGSAIYLNNLKSPAGSRISRSEFIDNRAVMSGGAVFLKNVKQIEIAMNKFLENQAWPVHNKTQSGRDGEGAALIFECRSKPCNVTVRSNYFVANRALSKGGALMWTNVNFTNTDVPATWADFDTLKPSLVAQMPGWMEKYTVNNTAPGVVEKNTPIIRVVNTSSYYQFGDPDDEFIYIRNASESENSTDMIHQDQQQDDEEEAKMNQVNEEGEAKMNQIDKMMLTSHPALQTEIVPHNKTQGTRIPLRKLGSNYYQGNEAPYGAVIASYPKSVDLKGNNGTNWKRVDKDTLIITPGVNLNFEIEILDQDDRLYSDENFAVAQFKFVNKTGLDQHSNILSANSIAEYGSFAYDYLKIRLQPGVSTFVQFKVSDLENYGNDIPEIVKPRKFNVTSRTCMEGEQYTKNLECIPCARGFYSYVQMTKPGNCSRCADHMVCYGGTHTTTKKGYWRSSATSKDYLKCPNAEACLDGDQANPIGICKKGYHGILCRDCDNGYSRRMNFRCDQCPGPVSLWLLLIFQGVLFFSLFIVICYFTFSSLSMTVSTYGTLPYARIFLNHLQIGAIIGNIWVPLPRVMNNFAFSDYLHSYSGVLYIMDCFNRKPESSEDPNIESSILYTRLIWILVFGLAMTLGNGVFWLFKTRGDMSKAYISWKQVQVIIVYFFYPAIINYLTMTGVYFFTEGHHGGEQRLYFDPKILAFSGGHLMFFIFVTVPGLVLFGLGLPLAVYFDTRRQKQLNNQIQLKMDFSAKKNLKELPERQANFLTIGLTKPFWYWELITLAQKGTLQFIVQLVSPRGDDYQVLLALAHCALFLGIYTAVKPYNTSRQNLFVRLSHACLVFYLYWDLYALTLDSIDSITWHQAVLYLMIVITSLIFIGIFLMYIRQEVLMYALKRNENIFRQLTCNRLDINKFRKQYMIQDQTKQEEESSDVELQMSSSEYVKEVKKLPEQTMNTHFYEKTQTKEEASFVLQKSKSKKKVSQPEPQVIPSAEKTKKNLTASSSKKSSSDPDDGSGGKQRTIRFKADTDIIGPEDVLVNLNERKTLVQQPEKAHDPVSTVSAYKDSASSSSEEKRPSWVLNRGRKQQMPSQRSRNSDISNHSSFRPAQNFEYANELEFKNEKQHRMPKKKDMDLFAKNESSSSFSDELDRSMKIVRTSRQRRIRNQSNYNTVSRSQNFTSNRTRTPDRTADIDGASPSAATSYMGDVPASESTTRKRNPFKAAPKRQVNHTRINSRQIDDEALRRWNGIPLKERSITGNEVYPPPLESFAGGVGKMTFGDGTQQNLDVRNTKVWLQSPVSGKQDSEFVTIKSALESVSQSDQSDRFADISTPGTHRNKEVAALMVRPSDVMDTQKAVVSSAYQLTSEYLITKEEDPNQLTGEILNAGDLLIRQNLERKQRNFESPIQENQEEEENQSSSLRDSTPPRSRKGKNKNRI